jgi:hypothetical protein
MATVLDGTKPCLDYLDKEMTIQGVLSAFSFAAAAALFSGILAPANRTSELVHTVQCSGTPYLLAGCVFLVVSGAVFYGERATLSSLYQVMALATAYESLDQKHPSDSPSVLGCLNDLDSWYLWFWLKVGLACLAAAALECVLAFVSTIGPFRSFTHKNIAACLVSVLPLGRGVWLHFTLRSRDEKG